MNPPVRLIIFARAPVAGECKTRLIPALGAEGAAALHARLVEHALRIAIASGAGPVSLWCSGDAADPFFQHCATEFDVPLHVQSAGDLGERMLGAFASTEGPALLAGSDVPSITAQDWQDCAKALEDHDAAFLPAEDGGYALVGMRHPRAKIFRDMAWSHAGVMDETRARMRAAGMTWREVRTVWDVDEEPGLARLRETFPHLL
jgi:rSAM/selenodomain-associated transferase 1